MLQESHLYDLPLCDFMIEKNTAIIVVVLDKISGLKCILNSSKNDIHTTLYTS